MKIFSNGVSKKMITELEEKVDSHITNTKIGVMQVICNSNVTSFNIPYPEGFNGNNSKLLCYYHNGSDDGTMTYINKVEGYGESEVYLESLDFFIDNDDKTLSASLRLPDNAGNVYVYGYINFYFIKI